MRTRVVKKNNKELLTRRGKGFYGRCLPVQFGDNYLVVQNIKGRPRTEAIVRYVDFEPTDTEILKLQQIFLQKYGRELLILKSYSHICGSIEDGKLFVRHLSPVNNQSQLELAE